MSEEVAYLPLPGHSHIPGLNARHPGDAFDFITGRTLAVTCDATASSNIVWAYGLRLLSEGYFWEAHEVLEPVWLNAAPNSREKHLVQGVIHIANAALKLRMDRPEAALRLSGLAQAAIREAFVGREDQTLMGLDAAEMQNCAARCSTRPFSFKI